jgi:S1-C subfamily serine protease
VDGKPVDDPKALSDRLLDFRPDDVVTLTVLRDGSERAVRVRLKERPNDVSG